MFANWKKGLSLTVLAGLVLAVVILATRSQPALAQRDGNQSAYPRYSVIDSEGHNLIVTDNQRNKLYFYTIDKDAKIGSELKLRGSLDLTQVGKPTLKVTRAKKEE
jgi:hypothetical protein